MWRLSISRNDSARTADGAFEDVTEFIVASHEKNLKHGGTEETEECTNGKFREPWRCLIQVCLTCRDFPP